MSNSITNSLTFRGQITLPKNYHLLLCISIIMILSSGCSSSKISSFPDCGVNQENLNNEIGIFVEKDWNTFKNGSEITFDVYLKQKNIRFVAPSNLNNQVFVYDSKKDDWFETENKMVILDNIDLTLDNQQPLIIFGVMPELRDKDIKNTVYICVKGNLVINNEASDNLVGASVLVKLRP